MLALGRELAAALDRAGMRPVLTREEDVFVPLQRRMTIARAAGADVLLSLHADALEADAASGASIYTLTQEAVDGASARMVERHEAGDLLAGLDLQGQDDELATALMDLARLDTTPRSERLAQAVAGALEEAGAVVNGRALRQANLAVLQAADFPSVLIEVGFLSDAGDRMRLATPEGRAAIVAGLAAALGDWAAEEAEREPLLRR
jgi:N-acetylmuramoyl-L-alanine amidase